jgi:DNA-binding transcriptional regulator YhcF (GntR family)
MIEAGVLAPGAQLPPIRQLAADLGLATNTVARAYRELESAGLVLSRVGHGTTLAARTGLLPAAEIRRRLEDAARSFAAVARRLGVDPAEAEAAVRAALPRTSTARRPAGAALEARLCAGHHDVCPASSCVG